jgi:hypothetical protein
VPYIGGRATASRGFFGGGSVPTAPTNLSSIEGNQQLTISFTAPAFNGGLNISNYEYALSTDGGSSYGSWTALSPVDTASPVTIGGLTNGQQYYVKLRAVNALGSGASSDPLSTNTNPYTIAGKPTITGVVSGSSQNVTVTYSAPTSNGGRSISKYWVQYSSNSGASWSSPIDSGNDLSETVGSLSNGTSYVFRVYAETAAGAGQVSDNSSPVTPYTVPDAVGTPSSSSGDRRFTISWSAPGNGGSAITEYQVEYSIDDGANWVGAQTTTSTSYTWTLANGTSYVGRVRAKNARDYGGYSAKSTARTPTFAAPSVSIAGVSGYPTDGNSATYGKRPVNITFSPTACENYDRTEIYFTTDSDFIVGQSFGPFYSSAANQVQRVDTYNSLFGAASISPGMYVTATVTTYNTEGHGVSSSTSFTTSGWVTSGYRTYNTSYDTDTKKVTGGSMARTYFNWTTGNDDAIYSSTVYAYISLSTSYTVTSNRNPSVGISASNSTTGAGHDSATLLSLNSGSSWPTGGTTRSRAWDFTDGAYDKAGFYRFSVIGGGSITGTWAANEQIDVYLRIYYTHRYTEQI